MHAIKAVRKYIENHHGSEASRVLAELVAALGDERDYALSNLYQIDDEAFGLAVDLLQDWRPDRYYAARIKLFNVAFGEIEPGGQVPRAVGASATPAQPPSQASGGYR